MRTELNFYIDSLHKHRVTDAYGRKIHEGLDLDGAGFLRLSKEDKDKLRYDMIQQKR